MKKKVLSVLLAACLLVGCLPLGAGAEGRPGETYQWNDTKTKTVLTIPSTWTEGQTSSGNSVIRAKFKPDNSESFVMLLFGGMDTWGKLSASEQKEIPREKADNSMFTEEDIVAMFAGSEDNKPEVSMVEYGGKEYFSLGGTSSTSVLGQEVEVPRMMLIRLENGYLYQFQFYGEQEGQYFEDFEYIVSNASLNAEAAESETVSKVESASSETAGNSLPEINHEIRDLKSASDSKAISSALFAGIGTALVALIAVLIIRVAKRKK